MAAQITVCSQCHVGVADINAYLQHWRDAHGHRRQPDDLRIGLAREQDAVRRDVPADQPLPPAANQLLPPAADQPLPPTADEPPAPAAPVLRGFNRFRQEQIQRLTVAARRHQREINHVRFLLPDFDLPLTAMDAHQAEFDAWKVAHLPPPDAQHPPPARAGGPALLDFEKFREEQSGRLADAAEIHQGRLDDFRSVFPEYAAAIDAHQARFDAWKATAANL